MILALLFISFLNQSHAGLRQDFINYLKNQQLDQEFNLQGSNLSTSYDEDYNWQGRLCLNRFGSMGNFETEIEDFKIDLIPDGSLKVTSILKNIRTNPYGYYRLDYTLCNTIHYRREIQVNQAILEGILNFEDSPQGDLIPRLQITRSELSRLYLSRYLPDSIEKYLTKKINVLINRVWSSKLGATINTMISEFLTKKFKEGAPSSTASN